MNKFGLIMCVVLLTGCNGINESLGKINYCIWACNDQTNIQQKYVQKRDQCQQLAELKLPLYVRTNNIFLDEKTKNAQLLALFSECMHEEDWAVTGPKVEPPVASVYTPPELPVFSAARSAQSPAAPPPPDAPIGPSTAAPIATAPSAAAPAAPATTAPAPAAAPPAAAPSGSSK